MEKSVGDMELVRCNRKINFECQRCGKCCLKFSLPVGFNDISIIKNKTGLPITRFLIRGKMKSPSSGMIFESWELLQPCVFYDHEKRSCTINDFKPQVCKLYPFILSKDLHTRKMMYEYDSNCHGVGKGDKIDLYEFVSLWKKYHADLRILEKNPEKIKELISEEELEEESKMLEEGLKEFYNYKIENIGDNTFAHSGVDFQLLEKINKRIDEAVILLRKRGVKNVAFVFKLYDLNSNFLGTVHCINRRLNNIEEIIIETTKIVMNTYNLSKEDFGRVFNNIYIDAFDKPPVDDLDKYFDTKG